MLQAGETRTEYGMERAWVVTDPEDEMSGDHWLFRDENGLVADIRVYPVNGNDQPNGIWHLTVGEDAALEFEEYVVGPSVKRTTGEAVTAEQHAFRVAHGYAICDDMGDY